MDSSPRSTILIWNWVHPLQFSLIIEVFIGPLLFLIECIWCLFSTEHFVVEVTVRIVAASEVFVTHLFQLTDREKLWTCSFSTCLHLGMCLGHVKLRSYASHLLHGWSRAIKCNSCLLDFISIRRLLVLLYRILYFIQIF